MDRAIAPLNGGGEQRAARDVQGHVEPKPGKGAVRGAAGAVSDPEGNQIHDLGRLLIGCIKTKCNDSSFSIFMSLRNLDSSAIFRKKGRAESPHLRISNRLNKQCFA